MGKQYLYKLYDESGNYIKTLDNVSSELSFSIEINSPGSELVIRLAAPADNFGERTEIDFNHQIKIYAIDDDSPIGELVYQGIITNYAPSFGSEEVNIHLRSFGSDLNDYMIDIGDSIFQESEDSEIIFAAQGFSYYIIAQTFTLTEPSRIHSLELFLSSSDNSQIRASICSGTPSTYSVAISNLQGSVSKYLGTSEPIVSEFSFSTPLELPAGTYFIMAEIPSHGSGLGNKIKVNNNTNKYSGGQVYQATDATSDPTQTFSAVTGGSANSAYDIWFRINAGATQPYYSQDPSDILRSILDHYQTQGGLISYDASSIDDTDTEVSYTFNTNTTLEGVKKILELAPVDWYWYVDPTTNLLHFHRKSASISRNYVLGRDIVSLKPEKRSEDIINVIYFTGGGDPPLFRKYEDATSIAAYGRRVYKYVDQRVTNTVTADIIASTLLKQRNAPEIRLSFEVADNNVDQLSGIDIEAITIGETVAIRNAGGAGSSLWDVAFWDVDYWDFNITELGTVVLQIVRLEMTPSSMRVFCSTIPPDVSKRMEDINRNLQASQTVNNETVTEAEVV